VIYVGTSGWQYRHWFGVFYPRKPRVGDDLAYFAQHFQTVELNGTFYKLPERRTFSGWARRTPDDFVFAVKASRFLTHIKRLRDPAEPVARLVARAEALGPKLGPILLQLPPNLERDDALLDATLREFDGRRVAVEFRHPSWEDDTIRRLLVHHDAALCIADRGSRLVTPAWRTADWGYVRFHAGASPRGCYGDRALSSRADLLRDLFEPRADVFVYFNNDGHACAIRDADRFARAAADAGLEPTRVSAAPLRRRAA
jgi:uncharacterized protein YecE (DUF72 family)